MVPKSPCNSPALGLALNISEFLDTLEVFVFLKHELNLKMKATKP